VVSSKEHMSSLIAVGEPFQQIGKNTLE